MFHVVISGWYEDLQFKVNYYFIKNNNNFIAVYQIKINFFRN